MKTISLLMILIGWMTACTVAPALPTPMAIIDPTATTAPTATPTIVETPTRVPLPTAIHPEHLDVFEEVWSTIYLTYFDDDFGGLDWYAIHAQYKPLILEAEDGQAFYQVLNQMLWELNVSHVGVGPADAWPSIEPVVFESGDPGLDVRLLDDQVVITRVETGSPAEEAGLRPGFILQSIEGRPVEQILAEAEGQLSPPYNDRGRLEGLTRHLLSLIYGDPGTCVTLGYLDEGDGLQEACIEREERPWEASLEGNPLPPSYLEFESGRLEKGIGYIRFNTFHPALIPEIKQAVADMLDAPGIILDLRGNPGGALTSVEELSALFLDGEATLGSLITRTGKIEMKVNGENVFPGPVVILIDGSSYSASECFSSAMQTLGRAVIIGERSPGGVTGMNVKTLQNGDLLGYPMLQFVTPDRIVREGYGVIPDLSVSLDRDQLLQGIDAQLQAAIEYLNNRE